MEDMTYKEWKEKYVKEHGQKDFDLKQKSTQNMKADKEQYKKYKSVLGKNAPKSLEEFQRIKYNDSSGWGDLKEYYGYVRINSGATRNDYECVKELHSLFPTGSFHIPPRKIDVEKLTFDDEHINKERGHNVTKNEAVSYIKTAKVSRTVWNGKFERYYSEKGAAYVNVNENVIRTAFNSLQYDKETKSIIEVIRKYGI